VLQPALLGGLFIGVLSALPIVNVANCCCLWMVSGGMLAAYLARDERLDRLTAGQGALVGLLAGTIGSLVWLFAALAVNVVIAPLQQRMAAEILRRGVDMPPEVREWFDLMAAGSGSAVGFVFGFAFHLVAGAVFGSLGGVLGAELFRRDVPPALGGPPPLPPQSS
jgi:hypothetical protein